VGRRKEGREKSPIRKEQGDVVWEGGRKEGKTGCSGSEYYPIPTQTVLVGLGKRSMIIVYFIIQ
jgi:hypothetical protein